jgi:hypothetical protein
MPRHGHPPSDPGYDARASGERVPADQVEHDVHPTACGMAQHLVGAELADPGRLVGPASVSTTSSGAAERVMSRVVAQLVTRSASAPPPNGTTVGSAGDW